MPQLRTEWDSRLTAEERLALKTAGSGWASGDAPITPEQAKEYALEHSFQNASAVSEKRLKAEALTYAVGSVLPQNCCRYSTAPGSHRRNTGGAINGHDKDRAAR